MKLPQPSSDALDSSAALSQKIMDEIAINGGWISFSRYMEMALYEPGLGYYSSGGKKLGRQGDFVTAPEISPLFGQTIARAILPFLQQSSLHILELGAGTGCLAQDILTELLQEGVALERYDILDLSADLKHQQQQTLSQFKNVSWLKTLPDDFTGVIIGNEVLDAMPVQLVLKKNSQWHELGVVVEDGHFTFGTQKADEALLKQIARQISGHEGLPDGYMTEVHTHACAFMRSLLQMQQRGNGSVSLFFDYGFPAHEYYLPQRSQGTLMSHYRHRSHFDPFSRVGLQDITSHVDFSVMAKTVIESDIALLCYASQADFLLAAEITDLLLRLSPEDPVTYLPQAKKAQILLSPAEMGELFKVLIFGNLDLPEALLRIDRSERL